jgi:transglutaminase-like putative cysteine protease
MNKLLRVQAMPVTGESRLTGGSGGRCVSTDCHPSRALSLRVGFDMRFDIAGPWETAMVFMLHTHPEVAGKLEEPERLVVEPAGVEAEVFLDAMGNRCARLIAPVGSLRVAYENVFRTNMEPDAQPDATTAQEWAGKLPTGVLPFLLGSRYCEVDGLSAVAWDLFGKLPPGGTRVLAINKWVFDNIRFGYRFTRPNKTAVDTYVERTGVCRDMMHLAIAFCRAMNIPARYATGYLADIDADPDPTPMDFSAFYEVYLGGRWWPMDARNGRPRVGRVLMARGRDATDVAMVTSFGRHKLTKFTVITEPIPAPTLPMPAPASPAALARSA